MYVYAEGGCEFIKHNFFFLIRQQLSKCENVALAGSADDCGRSENKNNNDVLLKTLDKPCHGW